ncbi:hypothetical protein, partial [Paenibacillus periandrae]|uniref:hypothetical protein n=1 Tax=Paenibacillus periandrae TaxID=1761741 RepID=UPI001F089205
NVRNKVDLFMRSPLFGMVWWYLPFTRIGGLFCYIFWLINRRDFGQIIVYVYQQALEKKPLFDILKHLKIPA